MMQLMRKKFNHENEKKKTTITCEMSFSGLGNNIFPAPFSVCPQVIG